MIPVRRRVLVPVAVTALAASMVAAVNATTATAQSADWRAQAGPAIFHQPPPRAPQFENTGIWKADPTQVCMTSAYRKGEYLYQGCLWDDQGGGVPLEWPENTMVKAYKYPTDPVYRSNAADLLELRVKPLPDATAFRLTYNTMTNPDLVATTIAIGSSSAPVAMPHGANTKTPAQVFATVHGDDVELVDAGTGKKVGTVQAAVDKERRQVEMRVPHSVYDPSGKKVRLAAGTGLWDTAAGKYKVPGALPTEDQPGGALPTTLTPTAFFDVAFRYDEPLDSAWRDKQQKETLLTGDISKFHTTVDFPKLATHVDDNMTGQRGGVPKTGYIQRIYPTHFESGQGRRQPSDPGAPPVGAQTQQGGPTLSSDDEEQPSGQFGWICRDDCVPGLAGQLQRYIAYVPKQAAPSGGYGSLTWTPGYAMTPADFVHETGGDLYASVANRTSAPTVVMVVDARGNDNWFYGQSGASVFEALADLGRHYQLDPDRRMMGGFSSGAYGANKLSLQFPDFFSKAFPCDGLNKAPSFPGINAVADTLPADTVTQHEPGSTLTPLLPSRRNQPVMEWAGLPDDFIPTNIPRERADAYAAGDYDYEFDTWAGASGSHLILCDNGTWDVFTKWAGAGVRTGTPAHVTYVRNPLMDDPKSGLVGDSAYWVTDVQTRSTDTHGTVDVFSHGFGQAKPKVPGVTTDAATASGTQVPLNPYTREFRNLPAAASAAVADRLDITASNIKTVTVDPRQARVSCDATLNVESDGPVEVVLLGCGAPRTFGS